MATIITNFRIYTYIDVNKLNEWIIEIIELDNDEEIKAVINHDYVIEDIGCNCDDYYCNLCKCNN
tara:strand:+ start:504 stop:698 length:195 start_codon:yes stop_codon:yes gene_type:complete